MRRWQTLLVHLDDAFANSLIEVDLGSIRRTALDLSDLGDLSRAVPGYNVDKIGKLSESFGIVLSRMKSGCARLALANLARVRANRDPTCSLSDQQRCTYHPVSEWAATSYPSVP